MGWPLLYEIPLGMICLYGKIMVHSTFSHTLQLMPNAFAGLPNLANLTLNMCRIKDIDATVFNISSLRYLDLSGNEFRDEF